MKRRAFLKRLSGLLVAPAFIPAERMMWVPKPIATPPADDVVFPPLDLERCTLYGIIWSSQGHQVIPVRYENGVIVPAGPFKIALPGDTVSLNDRPVMTLL